MTWATMDEVLKFCTVCWLTTVSYALTWVHDALSFMSVLFAAIIGGHAVWRIWKGDR